MRPRLLLTELGRRRRFLMLMVLVGLMASFVSSRQPARYTATATLYLGSAGTDAEVSVLSDTNIALTSAQTFSLLLASTPVIETMLARTGIEREADQVERTTTVRPEPGTQLLRVSVRDKDPRAARLLADGLADTFVASVSDEGNRDVLGDEGDLPLSPAYVFHHAPLPTRPDERGHPAQHALAGLFGLLLGVATVGAVFVLDGTIREAPRAQAELGLPVLGTIPMLADEVADPSGGRRRHMVPLRT